MWRRADVTAAAVLRRRRRALMPGAGAPGGVPGGTEADDFDDPFLELDFSRGHYALILQAQALQVSTFCF